MINYEDKIQLFYTATCDGCGNTTSGTILILYWIGDQACHPAPEDQLFKDGWCIVNRFGTGFPDESLHYCPDCEIPKHP